MPAFTSVNSNTVGSSASVDKDKCVRPESLNNFLIFCTSDFTTVFKEVHLRTRRVRLVGLEGSGKTTLLKAIMNKCKPSTATYDDAVSNIDVQEVIADGLCYCDSAGINMQELARDRLMMELAREQRISNDGSKNGVGKAISLNSAAVGASLGAGLGFVLAIVMGVASVLRKP